MISLYHRDGHGPADTVEHHYREMPDGPLTAAHLADACELAQTAVAAVRAGRKLLVRCHSGYNRSGLVVVQALIQLGYPVDDAVFLIRYRRSKWALNNHLFVEYLTTGLDLAPSPKRTADNPLLTLTTWGCHNAGMTQRSTDHQQAFDRLRLVRAEAIEYTRKAQQLAAERRDLIRQLIGDGFSQADIARELGVSRQAIQKMLAC